MGCVLHPSGLSTVTGTSSKPSCGLRPRLRGWRGALGSSCSPRTGYRIRRSQADAVFTSDGDCVARPVRRTRHRRPVGPASLRSPSHARSCRDRHRQFGPLPKKLRVTRWSPRLLVDHLGIIVYAVANAWREYGVQPWRAEMFEFPLPGTASQGPRRRQSVPESTRERDRVVPCMKVADPGTRPQPADASDAAGFGRAAYPGLQAPRHHFAVRRTRHRHRQDHRLLSALF